MGSLRLGFQAELLAEVKMLIIHTIMCGRRPGERSPALAAGTQPFSSSARGEVAPDIRKLPAVTNPPWAFSLSPNNTRSDELHYSSVSIAE